MIEMNLFDVKNLFCSTSMLKVQAYIFKEMLHMSLTGTDHCYCKLSWKTQS